MTIPNKLTCRRLCPHFVSRCPRHGCSLPARFTRKNFSGRRARLRQFAPARYVGSKKPTTPVCRLAVGGADLQKIESAVFARGRIVVCQKESGRGETAVTRRVTRISGARRQRNQVVRRLYQVITHNLCGQRTNFFRETGPECCVCSCACGCE